MNIFKKFSIFLGKVEKLRQERFRKRHKSEIDLVKKLTSRKHKHK